MPFLSLLLCLLQLRCWPQSAGSGVWAGPVAGVTAGLSTANPPSARMEGWLDKLEEKQPSTAYINQLTFKAITANYLTGHRDDQQGDNVCDFIQN
jgi:hypothetical protein